jgi:hypothetical protein
VVSHANIGEKMNALDSSYDESMSMASEDFLSFKDLYQIKDDFTFDSSENLYDISEIITKELEKENL